MYRRKRSRCGKPIQAGVVFVVALLVAAMACTAAASAERWALLIGISCYPYLARQQQLEGPLFDVAALRGMLKRKYRFSERTIITLINEQASRSAILDAIRRLGDLTRAGDTVLIYFSGHGTSSYDRRVKALGLDPFTGALVPADFRMGDVQAMCSRLIIGNRDLQPLLKKLDGDRRVFVVFDACYSGCTVRTYPQPWTVYRYLGIDWNGADEACKPSDPYEDLTGDGVIPFRPAALPQPPYPYRTIVYLSASGPWQKAQDISSGLIRSGKVTTVDGHPHGALTNALVAALAGSADLNHDRRICFGELYQFVTEQVTEHFAQTPQLLYNEQANVLNQPIFDKRISVETAALVSGSAKLRLQLHNLAPALAAQITDLAGVMIGEGEHDLLVNRSGDYFELFLAGGQLLARYPVAEPQALLTRIARQVRIKRLVALRPARQRFNVFLEIPGFQGVLFENDTVDFVIRAEAECAPLLLDIDPTGFINVLYPSTWDQLNKRLQAGQCLRLHRLGVVTPPFGTEFVKLFAFKNRPQHLSELVASEFAPDDRRLRLLLDMVHDPRAQTAQATLRVRTSPRAAGR